MKFKRDESSDWRVCTIHPVRPFPPPVGPHDPSLDLIYFMASLRGSSGPN